MSDIIPVIFRAERSGKFKGDVTAVFPTLPADHDGPVMTCYARIGQHSGCSKEWYNTTRPAKPAEYASLQKELEQIGYQLKVYSRITREHRKAFRVVRF